MKYTEKDIKKAFEAGQHSMFMKKEKKFVRYKNSIEYLNSLIDKH